MRQNATSAFVNDFKAAEHAGYISRSAGGISKTHPVNRERRGIVELEDSGIDPLAQYQAGLVITAGTVGLAWDIDVGDVELVTTVQVVNISG